MRFSACIEWLFAAETPDVPNRIRAAKAAGLDAVEFWRFSNKDLAAVKTALDETGLPLAGILCEPISPLTNPDAHPQFLEGVQTSLAAAQRLGAGMMIAQAGDDQPGVARAAQHAAIVRVLQEAARILEGSGVVLAWEGEGHTAYPETRCVTAAVNKYLINLEPPRHQTTCPAA